MYVVLELYKNGLLLPLGTVIACIGSAKAMDDHLIKYFIWLIDLSIYVVVVVVVVVAAAVVEVAASAAQ